MAGRHSRPSTGRDETSVVVRRRRVLVGAVAALLVGATATYAMTRGPDTSASVTATSSTTALSPSPTTPVDTRPRAPLTGKVVADAAALHHPAVAIKVSDVPEAHPQVGLNSADIVFVEPIGVSYTRLNAVFHSHLPETVGPVRSVRPMDAPLLGPMNPVFGNTMGATWVMKYVDRVGHLDNLGTLRVPHTSGSYTIDPHRVPVNNVFAHPVKLMAQSKLTAPPAPYFPFAKDAALASPVGGKAATSVVIPYGPHWNVSWVYDAAHGYYRRSQPWGKHILADGKQVHSTNVLVIKVGSDVGKIGTASGQPVPILDLISSSGSFILLSGGHSVTGTWAKGSVNSRFVFTVGGAPLAMTPGNTWVELPTPTAKVVVH